MNLFDDIRTQSTGLTAQSLGIRHFGGADARELPVNQIGAHLALDHRKAPVADVLQQKHTQHDLGRDAQASARPALRVPFQKTFIDRVNQLFVFQDLVRLTHPWLPQFAGLLGDQAISETVLRGPAQLDHFEIPFLRTTAGLARSNCWLSSQISSSAAFSV
jgi:hypothetical protein